MAEIANDQLITLYTDTEQFRRDQFDEFLNLVLKFLKTCTHDDIYNQVFYLT